MRLHPCVRNIPIQLLAKGRSAFAFEDIDARNKREYTQRRTFDNSKKTKFCQVTKPNKNFLFLVKNITDKENLSKELKKSKDVREWIKKLTYFDKR